MKIAYLANVRLPTEKAHGVQIMQMCAAFASNGHEVTLIVPKRRNRLKETPWAYYGMRPSFTIVEVPIFDFIPFDRWLGNAALWFTTLWFATAARKAVKACAPDLIYSRDVALSPLAPQGTPFVFEAHDFPSKPWLNRRWWRQCARIVTVTEGLRRAFLAAGEPEDKVVTAHDAVDLETFRTGENRDEARRALGLPVEGFLAVYTGHLYPYKGADDLLEACAHLPPGERVVFVGGSPEEVERLKARAAAIGVTNARFVGRVPHADIPRYLRAADAAVLPTRGTDRHASEFLSPLKLFEYLAAGKAIVATDLPSVREVLDELTAVFVPPEDPEALAQALRSLADVPLERERLARAAEALARERTWSRRADAVLSGLPQSHAFVTWFRRHRFILGMMALAFFVRAAFVLIFPPRIGGGDGGLYVGYADLLRGIPNWVPYMETYFQPGYPFFLALVRTVFGESVIAIGLAQSVVAACTVGLIAHMADRWIGRRAALFAGLTAALYAPWIVETGTVYTETLYTLLLTVATYALVRVIMARKAWHAAFVGGLFVLAGFVRELALYEGVMMAVVLSAWKRSWRLAIGLLVPIAAFLFVFGTYNRQVASEQSVARVPIMAKAYEATLQDADSRRHLLRWQRYPEGLWKFFRYPNRLAQISDTVSSKAALFSGDPKLIMAEAPYLLAKGFLTILHWLLLALAAYGLRRGRLPREAKVVFLLSIAFAAGTIILSGAAREQGFQYLEPLARYRFPVEPLILVLAAAGVDVLALRKEKTSV